MKVQFDIGKVLVAEMYSLLVAEINNNKPRLNYHEMEISPLRLR